MALNVNIYASYLLIYISFSFELHPHCSVWWVAYQLIRKSVGVTHRGRKKEGKNGKMRESSQDKQVLPILPSVWTISTPFPNGQYEQFAKVSFNLVFGHRLWYKLYFLCLINVQMCLTLVYFIFLKEEIKMGWIFKGWILPASNLQGQNHARRALTRYGLWLHY